MALLLMQYSLCTVIIDCVALMGSKHVVHLAAISFLHVRGTDSFGFC